MSDLGQFVAATIRDKVILELLHENKKLKGLLRQHSQVEICGTNGHPVYFRAELQVPEPLLHLCARPAGFFCLSTTRKEAESIMGRSMARGR